jgi:hypothetical protein
MLCAPEDAAQASQTMAGRTMALKRIIMPETSTIQD